MKNDNWLQIQYFIRNNVRSLIFGVLLIVFLLLAIIWAFSSRSNQPSQTQTANFSSSSSSVQFSSVRSSQSSVNTDSFVGKGPFRLIGDCKYDFSNPINSPESCVIATFSGEVIIPLSPSDTQNGKYVFSEFKLGFVQKNLQYFFEFQRTENAQNIKKLSAFSLDLDTKQIIKISEAEAQFCYRLENNVPIFPMEFRNNAVRYVNLFNNYSNTKLSVEGELATTSCRLNL